ncbi:MAG TPA: sigma factor, partial [Vicinamibacteria bacterium]|nr:sigma factor [Vicinamibacteria bacterium]
MRGGGILGVVLAAGLGSACFVEVHKVSDPRAAFEKARAEAQRYQGKPGPGHELNVLVYDGHDGELVRVSLPLWLVRKIDREALPPLMERHYRRLYRIALAYLRNPDDALDAVQEIFVKAFQNAVR